MTDLDARYGNTARASRQQKTISLAVIIALVVGVVVFWAATSLNPGATIEAQTGGYSVTSPNEVAVTARVSVQPGTPVACAIEATNEASSVVGYKVLELEPHDQQHQTVHVSLRTTSAANNAAIAGCWVLDASNASER